MYPKDKLLFTPGPLTTSRAVKEAMLRDLGSRDGAFIDLVAGIRVKLLDVAGVSKESGFEAVLMQGSGTFVIESVIGSTVPRDGKLLVIVNGAYGERMVKIASVLGIETSVLKVPENRKPDPRDVEAVLLKDASITNVAIVHCETATGMICPIGQVGQIVKSLNRIYFVDAMSSFGAVPISMDEAGIDFLVSSANKCIEGVPGFAFALVRRDALVATEGSARSLSLDLLGQWKGLERDGQFRFTPPTHALLAFDQALDDLVGEGGVSGRGARYQRNCEVLVHGMQALGFKPYLNREDQGYIITSFLYPSNAGFDFGEFYHRLSDKGMLIYLGKVSDADCFRIGSIGHLMEQDMRDLLAVVKEVLEEMGLVDRLRAGARR